MPSVNIYDMEGKSVGQKDLSENVFGAPVNTALVHSAVRVYLINQRQGTQSTLTRAEVRGGGKKPWRQKGTGRARQGSIRSPQWIHGGIALGPKPRDHRIALNKKARRAALKSVLSSKAGGGDIILVNDIAVNEFKTKTVLKMLSALGADKKALIIVDAHNQQLIKSAANLPGVKTAVADNLNVYDILNCDKLVASCAAVDKIEEVYA